MAPTRQQLRLKRFIICPTIGDCKFCNAGLARTKMIRVELTSDLVMDYTTRLVGVGGIFKVDAKDPTGVPYSISAELRGRAMRFSSRRVARGRGCFRQRRPPDFAMGSAAGFFSAWLRERFSTAMAWSSCSRRAQRPATLISNPK